MKSIEERAKAFANKRWPKENFKNNDRYRREHYQKSRDTYIQIATEQKKIDIDKACEWLGEHAKAHGEADGLDAVYLYDTDMLVRHFRKAMEE